MKNKVMIAVPTGEFARHSNFYDYYNQIERTDGTLHMFARGQSPAKNRNVMIQAALDNNCTHILFLDDDVIPPPDCLRKLLAHDKDVVSGLYPMRNWPHYPVAFDKCYPNGFNRHIHLKDELVGLIPITNCGFGCVLIKTNVFKLLPKPWVTLGELEADGWCDDIAFFNKVASAGFEMWCDTTILVDHMMTVHVGFRRTNDTWQINYDCRGQGNLQFPISYPESDIDKARAIEGWMSDKELSWLGKVAKESELIIEIGSYKGKSTRALADNCIGRIYAIDPWNGPYYRDDNSLDCINTAVFEEFKSNLKDHIDTSLVTPLHGFSRDYNFDSCADLIFIDGDHRYDAVKDDIERAKKWVKSGGIIAGHDYNQPNWPSVKQAVHELIPSFEVVDSIWYTQWMK